MASRFEELEGRLETSRKSSAYLMEAAIEAVIDEVSARLDALDWSDADLAREMGVSRTRVHKMLRGEDQNFTIRSLAGVARALGTGLSVTFPPEGYVAVPIYKPAAYRHPLRSAEHRTRLTVGETRVEGPMMAIDVTELEAVA